MVCPQIDVWWWQPKYIHNFGDELGAKILERMGYKVNKVGLRHAQLITSGTILHMADDLAPVDCTVWGSGVGWDAPITKRLDIRAVRGKLTADILGYSGIIGDPGLLVSRYWDKPKPKYGVGVVRHYVDHNDYEWADLIIDCGQPVDDIILQISQCETICSSSLHGLIVAESFGIPNMRIEHQAIIGTHFKYCDYLTALDRSIEKIQDELIDALLSRPIKKSAVYT